ncbi:hypothetical protein ABZ370_17685 [Streptomyces sp. NPDC005962]|uniref:hypothetical protein n=1 Tax=Streptomyces sp. NPDC005962 TaxID=3154466 RepID=UPI0033D01007
MTPRSREAEVSDDSGPLDGEQPQSYEEWTKHSGHVGGCDPLKRDPSSDVWRLLAALEIDGEDD